MPAISFDRITLATAHLSQRLFWISVLSIGICAVDAATIIEGVVELPPSRKKSGGSARYKLKSGQALAPEAPVAIVYLEGNFPATVVIQTNQVVQKGFQFSPALIAIQKGATIEFPNDDEDYHHVFSYSKTREFDLGRYRKDEQPPAVVFPNAGVVKIGCEIHNHMRAVVLVLETPHFTKTDSQGNYRLVLNEVPSGQYKLKAWISDKRVLERSIEIKPDLPALKVNFTEDP